MESAFPQPKQQLYILDAEGAITWASRPQSVVASSTMEAEYIAGSMDTRLMNKSNMKTDMAVCKLFSFLNNVRKDYV